MIALPLPTIKRRRGKRPPVAKLAEIGREQGVSHIIVGLPLTPAGRENEWCKEVREVGNSVAARIGAEMCFVDERLTSVRAEMAVRSLGLGKRKRAQKERVDAAAAQLILQRWLDGGSMGGSLEE